MTRSMRKLSKTERWALEYIRAYPDCTERELAIMACPLDTRRVGRPMLSLERLGLVLRCRKRRCTVSGSLAATWRAVKKSRIPGEFA